MRETRWVACSNCYPLFSTPRNTSLLYLASKLFGDHSLATNVAFSFFSNQHKERILIAYKNITPKKESLSSDQEKHLKGMFWILVPQKCIFHENIDIHLGRRLRREDSDTWLPRCQIVLFHVLFSKYYSQLHFLNGKVAWEKSLVDFFSYRRHWFTLILK